MLRSSMIYTAPQCKLSDSARRSRAPYEVLAVFVLISQGRRPCPYCHSRACPAVTHFLARVYMPCRRRRHGTRIVYRRVWCRRRRHHTPRYVIQAQLGYAKLCLGCRAAFGGTTHMYVVCGAFRPHTPRTCYAWVCFAEGEAHPRFKRSLLRKLRLFSHGASPRGTYPCVRSWLRQERTQGIIRAGFCFAKACAIMRTQALLRRACVRYSAGQLKLSRGIKRGCALPKARHTHV